MGLFGRAAGPSKDPVCGMMVDPKKAAGTASHDGVAFHFCSKSCLGKFNADPHRYGHAH